ncbi:MAG: response regulator [Dehalococcoidia bacterium]|nr:MAG: response regulator [Dehalococcoidia bacterium]
MSPPSDPPAAAPRRPRILVVEDEPGVRSMLDAVLRASGYEPLLAEDGQAAAERLAAGLRVDAVLTDVRMPRMDGVSLVVRLRSQELTRALPVIAMSAYNDERQEREMRAAGADLFLAKPFTVVALTDALRMLIVPRAS